jgi:hypothetical protein
MSRAWVIYFVMFGLLVGGLLLIMTMGDSVRAPDDLSGNWTVVWDNALPPEAGEPTMHVEQSGRYFVVRFGERPPMSMTLQPGWTGSTEGRRLDMKLARPAWQLRLSGDIPLKQRERVPEVRVELVGPTTHYGVARRVAPEQAADAIGGPATRPTASPPAAAETAHAR